jgi:hypothetical protein
MDNVIPALKKYDLYFSRIESLDSIHSFFVLQISNQMKNIKKQTPVS